MEEQGGHYSPPAATLTDPLRPAVPPGVGRRILGVLVGGIGVDLILGLSVTTVGTVIVAVVFRGDAASTVTLVASSILGLTFSALGGYTAAYVAPWRPALIGGLAGMASLLVSSPLMLLIPDGGWGTLEIGTAILHLPLAAWGGHLARNARS